MEPGRRTERRGATGTRPAAPVARLDPSACVALLGMRVRTGALDLGRVDDVVLGADDRPVGVSVQGRRGRRHFLPWVAARVEHGAVEATSLLTLLGEDELGFYLARGTSLVARDRAANGVRRIAQSGAPVPGIAGGAAVSTPVGRPAAAQAS